MTTAPSIRRDRLHWIAIAEWAAALALAAFIWRLGPTGPIPMHFDFHGRVDRWGDRGQASLMLVGVTLLMALFYGMITAMGRGHAPDESTARGLRSGRIVLLVMSAFLAVVTSEMVFAGFAPGEPDTVRGRLMAGTLSALFLMVGALIGKAGPNPFVGLRLYWALKSRLAWDKSNRLLGRLFFGVGLAGLIAAPFAPPAQEFPVLILAILGSAALAAIESWRVWRSDPERLLP
jgi:uncharacterized membrane protein